MPDQQQGEIIQLSREQLEEIVHECVKEAIRDTLLAIGLPTTDGIAVAAIQQDMAYLRSQRLASGRVRDWITRTSIVMVLGGIGAVIILGLQAKFGGPGK